MQPCLTMTHCTASLMYLCSSHEHCHDEVVAAHLLASALFSGAMQPMANNYFLYIIVAISGLAISCKILGYI